MQAMSLSPTQNWMNEHYAPFFDYAVGRLNQTDAEDIVQNLILKLMTSKGFEKYLVEQGDPSYGSVLTFAKKNHISVMNKMGKDALGRIQGYRTRNETRKDTATDRYVETITHKSSVEAVPMFSESGEMDGYDFCDHNQEDILDALITKETVAHIKAGIEREWDGEVLTPRLAVFDLLVNEGGDRKDIEAKLDVGPTRAKVIRAQVQAVARHCMDTDDKRNDFRKASEYARRTRRTRRNMAKSVEKIAKRDLSADQLTTAEVPQQGRLNHIIPALKFLAGETESHGLDLSTRHLQYLHQAMRVFGLIDRKNAVTERGREVLARWDDTRETRNAIMQELIESTAVGKAWMVHCGVTSFKKVDANTALDMLTARSSLSEGTAKRRARAIRRWVNFFSIGQ